MYPCKLTRLVERSKATPGSAAMPETLAIISHARGLLEQISTTTNHSYDMTSQSMSAELQLSIIFGCLATVLAILSVLMACLQYRTHNRLTTLSTTPSILESGRPQASTLFNRMQPTRPISLNQLQTPVVSPHPAMSDASRVL